MRIPAIIVAAAAAAFAGSCDGTGAGGAGDVRGEVIFLHGDPGPAEVAPPDDAVEPADPGTGDDVQADPGVPDVATEDDGGTPDPGVPDPGPPDPGVQDPGAPDPGVQDYVAPGSKKAGRYCEVSSECADGMQCVAGEHTHAQCNPGCEIDTDCDKVAINANGQCTEVVGLPFKVCLWLCGSLMGGICPGDGVCDSMACR